MKKKFAFFTGPFIVGGVEQVLVNTANILAKRGHSVTIVWSGAIQKNHIYEALSPLVKQIHCCSLFNLFLSTQKPKNKLKRKIWKLKYWYLFRNLKNTKKYLPDITDYDYLIDFRNGFSKVCDIPCTKKQKKIIWVHGAYSFISSKQMLKKSKIFQYDKIVCLTEKFRRQFITEYPQYTDKIKAIYNPFDFKLLNKQATEPCPQADALKPFFVHVARVDVDKDIPTMLNAYIDFYKKTHSSTKMVFLGEGSLKESFEKQVKEKGLEEQIFFIGNVSNPLAWISRAKALILSSLREGLPTVLIEGQIAGTLVVSSDCPNGPAEILKDGKAGILYPPKDVEKLSEILSDIDNGKIDPTPLILEATASLPRFDEQAFLKALENL